MINHSDDYEVDGINKKCILFCSENKIDRKNEIYVLSDLTPNGKIRKKKQTKKIFRYKKSNGCKMELVLFIFNI